MEIITCYIHAKVSTLNLPTTSQIPSWTDSSGYAMEFAHNAVALTYQLCLKMSLIQSAKPWRSFYRSCGMNVLTHVCLHFLNISVSPPAPAVNLTTAAMYIRILVESRVIAFSEMQRMGLQAVLKVVIDGISCIAWSEGCTWDALVEMKSTLVLLEDQKAAEKKGNRRFSCVASPVPQGESTLLPTLSQLVDGIG
jgi:hypothetical protein